MIKVKKDINFSTTTNTNSRNDFIHFFHNREKDTVDIRSYDIKLSKVVKRQ